MVVRNVVASLSRRKAAWVRRQRTLWMPLRDRATHPYRPRCETLEDRTVPSILFSSTGARMITDSGGPILDHMQVDLIFWGTGWNNGGGPGLRTTVQNLTTTILNSAYFDGLTQYRNIGHGSVLRSDTIATSSPGPTFKTAADGDLATMVATNINNGTLPAPNGQIVYYVIPQPGSVPSDCGCGGRHLASVASGNRVFPYGLVSNPTGVAIDFLSSLTSHELAEAATDPFWNINVNGRNQAAFIGPGGPGDEIGDGEPDGHYLYRLNNVQVQAYLSQRDHSYIVTDGNAQNFFVSSTRVLTIVGDQLANQNDTITLDTSGGGVKATLNGEVVQFDPLAINAIIVNPLTGTNTVTVARSIVPIHVNFLAGTADTINVGAPGNGLLDNLAAPVWAIGHAGDVNVIFNDQANAHAGDTYTVDKSRLTRTGLVGFFHYKQVRSLTLNTGTQNKTVTIKSTALNTPTTVNLNAGTVTLNIGDPNLGHLDGLRGAFVVHKQNAVVDAIINDQGDRRNGLVYTLTATTLTRSGGVNLTYDGLRSLTLNAGAGANTINVQGTSAPTTTINARPGVNTITVTATAANTTTNINMASGTLNLGNPGNGNLDNILGRVNYTGQPNAVDLVFNEQGNPNNDTYTMTNASLARTRNNLLFTYNQARSVTLNLGTGNNTVQLQSAVTGTTLRGGAGTNTAVVQGVISTADVTLINMQVLQINGGTLNVVNNLGVRMVIVTAGNLNVQAGTLTATATFAQAAGTTTINAGATVTAAGGATIQGGTLTGSGSVNANITNGGMLTGSLTVMGNVTNTGQVSPGVNGAAGVLTINGNFTQNPPGVVNITPNSTLRVTGAFTQAGGAAMVAAGAALTAGGGATIQAGTLSGAGSVNANVTNSGVLAGTLTVTGNVTHSGQLNPGGTGAAGIFTITGNYTQTGTGVLNIEIGGHNAGADYDVLHVGGAATLAGTLNVSLIRGFHPATGDHFQIVTFNSRSGDFATKNGLDLGGGLRFNPQYDAGSLTLVVNAHGVCSGSPSNGGGPGGGTPPGSLLYDNSDNSGFYFPPPDGAVPVEMGTAVLYSGGYHVNNFTFAYATTVPDNGMGPIEVIVNFYGSLAGDNGPDTANGPIACFDIPGLPGSPDGMTPTGYIVGPIDLAGAGVDFDWPSSTFPFDGMTTGNWVTFTYQQTGTGPILAGGGANDPPILNAFWSGTDLNAPYEPGSFFWTFGGQAPPAFYLQLGGTALGPSSGIGQRHSGVSLLGAKDVAGLELDQAPRSNQSLLAALALAPPAVVASPFAASQPITATGSVPDSSVVPTGTSAGESFPGRNDPDLIRHAYLPDTQAAVGAVPIRSAEPASNAAAAVRRLDAALVDPLFASEVLAPQAQRKILHWAEYELLDWVRPNVWPLL